jgi:hypothetical protein
MNFEGVEDYLKIRIQNYLEKFQINYFDICHNEKSYICGIKYHAINPKVNFFYTCLPESNNKYDENAIGVYTNQRERLGYVPKDLCIGLRQKIAEYSSSGRMDDTILLCFCRGPITKNSAQCNYLIIKMKNKVSVSVDSNNNNFDPQCKHDQEVKVKSFPCEHIICFDCIKYGKCPTCKVIIQSFEKTK